MKRSSAIFFTSIIDCKIDDVFHKNDLFFDFSVFSLSFASFYHINLSVSEWCRKINCFCFCIDILVVAYDNSPQFHLQMYLNRRLITETSIFSISFFFSRWNSKWTDCWRPSKAAQTYFSTTSRNQIKNLWFQQTDLNFSSRKVVLKRAIFLLHSKTICLKTITKIKHFTD